MKNSLHKPAWALTILLALSLLIGPLVSKQSQSNPNQAGPYVASTSPLQGGGRLPLPPADARTPIDAIPITIDTCGSYYLTNCVTGMAGKHGITIDANDVTLDLNGFTIRGVAGSLDAIHIRADSLNTVIQNGSIEGWGGHGVFMDRGTLAFKAQLTNLNLHHNNGSGAVAWGGCTILDCRAFLNGGDGFEIAGNSTIIRCFSNANTGDGISVTQEDCVVKDNLCKFNQQGIHVSGDGTDTDHLITENHLVDNKNYGLKVDFAGNLIVKNSAGGNTSGAYSIVTGNDVGTIGTAAMISDPWGNIQF